MAKRYKVERYVCGYDHKKNRPKYVYNHGDQLFDVYDSKYKVVFTTKNPNKPNPYYMRVPDFKSNSEFEHWQSQIKVSLTFDNKEMENVPRLGDFEECQIKICSDRLFHEFSTHIRRLYKNSKEDIQGIFEDTKKVISGEYHSTHDSQLGHNYFGNYAIFTQSDEEMIDNIDNERIYEVIEYKNIYWFNPTDQSAGEIRFIPERKIIPYIRRKHHGYVTITSIIK